MRIADFSHFCFSVEREPVTRDPFVTLQNEVSATRFVVAEAESFVLSQGLLE